MSRWRDTWVVAGWEIRRHARSPLQLAGVLLLPALILVVLRAPVTPFVRFLVFATAGYGVALAGAIASARRERHEGTLELATAALPVKHWLDGKLLGSAGGSILVWGCGLVAAWMLVRAHPVVALMVLVIWLAAAWITWRLVRTALARTLRRSLLTSRAPW